MAKEELKWQNIDADDLSAAVKKSFDAMVEAEAAFKADLEKLLKNAGHMPEDKFLVMSRKGKRPGVAFASTPRGEGGVRAHLPPHDYDRAASLRSRWEISITRARWASCSTSASAIARLDASRLASHSSRR